MKLTQADWDQLRKSPPQPKKKSNRLTADQRLLILNLRKQNVPYYIISKQMEISVNTIWHVAKENGMVKPNDKFKK